MLFSCCIVPIVFFLAAVFCADNSKSVKGTRRAIKNVMRCLENGDEDMASAFLMSMDKSPEPVFFAVAANVEHHFAFFDNILCYNPSLNFCFTYYMLMLNMIRDDLEGEDRRWWVDAFYLRFQAGQSVNLVEIFYQSIKFIRNFNQRTGNFPGTLMNAAVADPIVANPISNPAPTMAPPVLRDGPKILPPLNPGGMRRGGAPPAPQMRPNTPGLRGGPAPRIGRDNIANAHAAATAPVLRRNNQQPPVGLLEEIRQAQSTGRLRPPRVVVTPPTPGPSGLTACLLNRFESMRIPENATPLSLSTSNIGAGESAWESSSSSADEEPQSPRPVIALDNAPPLRPASPRPQPDDLPPAEHRIIPANGELVLPPVQTDGIASALLAVTALRAAFGSLSDSEDDSW